MNSLYQLISGVRRSDREWQSRRRTRRLFGEKLESRHLLASVPLAPLPVDDTFATNEDTPVAANVFIGNGADRAAKAGQQLRVAEVNGQQVSAAPVELSSGATLDIHSDGSFTYDPRTSLDLQALAGGERAIDEFTYTATPQFSDLFVFGDSLSDQGRLFAATGGSFPPDPPYFQGRFSNGEVWVEGAAGQLGLTTTLANNFSVGGATTGSENVNEAILGADLPGVADEIDAFVESNGPAADPDALYVIWAGTNDFFLPFDDPVPVITQAVTNVVTHAGTLYARGAEHVLVMNLPDLGSTPFGSSSPDLSSQLSQLTNAFNATLAGSLDAADLPVTQVDVFSRFRQIIGDPSAFGLTNVTTASLGDPSADPSTSLFWDSVHPTAKGHELIAEFVFEQLSDQAVVTIDVAGVTTVPTLQVENSTGINAGELRLSLSAGDVSAADQAAEFLYLVDWGDGGEPLAIPGAAEGLTLSYVFDGSGVARPTVQVIDQDGDASEPFREAVVWGTDAADVIRIRPAGGGTTALIRNGRLAAFLDADSVDRIVAFGMDGDDVLSAAGSRIATELDGGSGRDLLIGSKANDQLRGGNGNDILLGLGGNDMLDGGAGSDLLIGGPGEDSLTGAGQGRLGRGLLSHDAVTRGRRLLAGNRYR